MNRESNVYTILYASAMVIVIAVGLSFLHAALQDKQLRNVQIDNKQQILRALNVEATAAEAEAKYSELIKNAFLVAADGSIIPGSEGSEANKPAFSSLGARNVNAGLPVFEANVGGKTIYILEMRGAGMWGPVWGYLGVNADGSTIFGAEFGHQGETPGLGDAIVTPAFRNQFIGKELFKNGVFKSVAVVKAGTTAQGSDAVDGLSGGTVTSKGVGRMLFESIQPYENFLKNLRR